MDFAKEIQNPTFSDLANNQKYLWANLNLSTHNIVSKWDETFMEASKYNILVTWIFSKFLKLLKHPN